MMMVRRMRSLTGVGAAAHIRGALSHAARALIGGHEDIAEVLKMKTLRKM